MSHIDPKNSFGTTLSGRQRISRPRKLIIPSQLAIKSAWFHLIWPKTRFLSSLNESVAKLHFSAMYTHGARKMKFEIVRKVAVITIDN